MQGLRLEYRGQLFWKCESMATEYYLSAFLIHNCIPSAVYICVTQRFAFVPSAVYICVTQRFTFVPSAVYICVTQRFTFVPSAVYICDDCELVPPAENIPGIPLHPDCS
jgi:hypothetical protein